MPDKRAWMVLALAGILLVLASQYNPAEAG